MIDSFTWYALTLKFGDFSVVLNLFVFGAIIFATWLAPRLLFLALSKNYISRRFIENLAVDFNYLGSFLSIVAVGGAAALSVGNAQVAVVMFPRAITFGLILLLLGWHLQKFLLNSISIEVATVAEKSSKKISPYHLVVSLVALALALIHLLIPTINFDAATLFLLAIASLPWLAPIFKELDIPGVGKFVFQDKLLKVEKEAEKAGLLSGKVSGGSIPSYLMIADEDPNLALAGLRIEIEKQLRALAKSWNIDHQKFLGGLLSDLRNKEIITNEEVSILKDLTSILNHAVHGDEVGVASTRWALDIGSRILIELKKRTPKKPKKT